MIQTSRLLLRQWQASDYAPFIAMTQDAHVMEYFPALWTEEKARHFIDTMQKLIAARGWGFWAVDVLDTSEFIGFVGLNHVPDIVPITQIHEVGWRLIQSQWGKGYATEAAMASLHYAFDTLNLPEVVAFTPVANQRSRRVMEKTGMSLQEATFKYPTIPESSALSEHVLYQINQHAFITRDA